MKIFEKLEKFIFYFFIFSIPFQTRKILVFASSGGKFVEWNSGFLYFTDLLLIGIFVLWLIRLIRGKSDFRRKSDFLILGFFLIAGLSLITSLNINLSIYKLIKLAEFILLFLYIKYNLEFLKLNSILKIFVASGVFQAVLAILQFFNQSSLGLKHIEAGIYNANIPGVATFFVNGVKFIRAYGTTPHPNILGAFLIVSIFCLYALWFKESKLKKSLLLFSPRLTSLGLAIFYFLLFLGLFLTFSRAIIIVFFGASLLFFFIAFLKYKEQRKKIITLLLLFSIFCFLFSVIFWPEFKARFLGTSLDEQAVTLRVYYNDIAVSAIKEKPILGLGLGNFVWYLLNNYHLKEFWLYQPVHNIYLLIASEIGIFGLIVFLIFLGKILFKKLKRLIFNNASLVALCFTLCALSFAFLGLIDHYFWTIQQSSLVFWIVLGILSGLNLTGPRSLTDKAQASGA